MPINPFDIPQTIALVVGYTVFAVVFIVVGGFKVTSFVRRTVADLRKWFKEEFLQAYMDPMQANISTALNQQAAFANQQSVMLASQAATTEALLVLTHRVDGHDYILGIVQGRLFGGPISSPLAKDVRDVAESIATDDLLNHSEPSAPVSPIEEVD